MQETGDLIDIRESPGDSRKLNMYDVDEMNSISVKINMQIKEHVVCKISVEDVTKDVQRLKLGKSDGEEIQILIISYMVREYSMCC